MNKKILFLVDHKHRDLPSISLIGYHLKARGFAPTFVGVGDELAVIETFDPGFIVLPKPVYDYERLIRWKRDGRRLVVLETEGNPQDREFEMRIRIPPDLYLFWNEAMAERYRPQLPASQTTITVTGFPRSDFLHPRLARVFPDRQELMTQYGLDPARPTLTIATSAQDSHFSEDRVKQKRKRRVRSLAKTAEYLEIVANMRDLRDRTVELVTKLTKDAPHINIALKPHPHENVVFWADFIKSLNAPNVALVVGAPINHLLLISDLHVAFNVCTTTVEALLAGVPAIELQTGRSRVLYGESHLDVPTYRATSYADVAAAVEAELGSDRARRHEAPDQKAKLDVYVSTFLHVHDGRRCETSAAKIAAWIEDTAPAPRGWRVLLANPRLAALFGLVRLWARVRAVTDRTVDPDLIRQVNAPSAENARATRSVQGVVVDAEFGLFDNRMRPGDEREWMDRFARAFSPPC
ncbi:MAG: hypothetical protein FJX76_23870 [Armatimonadetes bacterium]|nr:hypothetical protein [Armatimonadota bacterium]